MRLAAPVAARAPRKHGLDRLENLRINDRLMRAWNTYPRFAGHADAEIRFVADFMLDTLHHCAGIKFIM